jgi:hypothetical protein
MDESDMRVSFTSEQIPETKPAKLSRRNFLRATLLTGAGALAAGCAASSTVEQQMPVVPSESPKSLDEKYPEVPSAPAAPPPFGVYRFFTSEEAATVEALTARIMPGSPDDPGAREAGVTTFIDNLLMFNQGYAEPTYASGPFAKAYEGNLPAEALSADPTKVVYVEKKELERYGYQSSQTPQAEYRAGIEAVDRYAQKKFGAKFTALSEDQQDKIVGDMAEDQAEGFGDKPGAKSFFKTLQKHTIQGMFSDPAYGGNRNMLGWRLVNYPGIQRAYTPTDLQTEGTKLPMQDLNRLPPFNPGQHVTGGVTLPVRSADQFEKPDDSLVNRILQYCNLAR